MAKPVVDFRMNEPVEVCLHWPEGRIVSGRFGERVMYSLDQPPEHVMFLDLPVAQQINMLEPGMNPFVICKRAAKKFDLWKPGGPPPARVMKPGASAVTRIDAPAPALVAPPAPPSHQTQVPANNNGNGSTNGNGKPPEAPAKPPIAAGWAQFLLSTTNDLVDIYAAALHYASERHGNGIKPEDVKSLLTTAYISQTKNGGPHVA